MLLDIKDDVLKIRLINFNNPLGTENISPIKVGTLDGKQLFFQFRVYAMDGNGQNNKLLNPFNVQ